MNVDDLREMIKEAYDPTLKENDAIQENKAEQYASPPTKDLIANPSEPASLTAKPNAIKKAFVEGFVEKCSEFGLADDEGLVHDLVEYGLTKLAVADESLLGRKALGPNYYANRDRDPKNCKKLQTKPNIYAV